MARNSKSNLFNRIAHLVQEEEFEEAVNSLLVIKNIYERRDLCYKLLSCYAISLATKKHGEVLVTDDRTRFENVRKRNGEGTYFPVLYRDPNDNLDGERDIIEKFVDCDNPLRGYFEYLRLIN